jgi:hypothetical protein
MIQSKFILDVLEHSLNYEGTDIILDDGINYWALARPQIKYLTDIEYDYTGVGLFVNFSHTEEALKYKSPVEGGPLGGIDIKSPDLEDSAYTLLWFKNGIIDSLEIFSGVGDYPKRDLKDYSFMVLPKNIINNLPKDSILENIKRIVKNLLRKLKS